MYRDGQLQPCGFAQTLEKRKVVGARKLGESRVAQERLEPDDAALRQLRHLAYAAGSQSSPQREIRDGGGFKCGTLPIELACGNGTRSRVQRHIEEQRATSRGECPAARRGSFPFGATRLIEVKMDIDQ